MNWGWHQRIIIEYHQRYASQPVEHKNEFRNRSTHAWSPDLQQLWPAFPCNRERTVFNNNA